MRNSVGAGVDPAGHRPVEALDRARPAGRAAVRRAPGTARRAPGRRCPGTMSRAPVRQQRGRRLGQQVEALLADRAGRSSRATRRRRRRGRSRARREEVRPAGGLAGRIGRRVGRGQAGIGRRIPDGRVDAVDDPEERGRPVASASRRRAPGRVEAEPTASVSPRANVGLTVLTRSARSMPVAQQVDPHRSGATDPVTGGQARAGQAGRRRPSRDRRGCGSSGSRPAGRARRSGRPA